MLLGALLVLLFYSTVIKISIHLRSQSVLQNLCYPFLWEAERYIIEKITQ